MAESLILKSEQAGIVRLTLNRPQKRNALTRELLHELKGHLKELAPRSDVRLLVLGAQGTAFCAGMDLAQMQETAALADAAAIWQADTEVYRDVVRLLFESSCPTLAVVPGPAVAGGLGLVLACDLVVAAETAIFGLPEPKRGITAAVVTPLLVHRVGMASASYLLLSGATVDARRGKEMGIVHVIAAPDELVAAARELERSILSGAPGALAMSKRQLRECAAADVLAQLDRAAVVSARARETPEAREGLQAFLEKRNPRWST
jgi:methylglutaconyl-CoA hydratase